MKTIKPIGAVTERNAREHEAALRVLFAHTQNVRRVAEGLLVSPKTVLRWMEVLKIQPPVKPPRRKAVTNRRIVSFQTTRPEASIIQRIAARAVKLLGMRLTDVSMDLAATHCNGCPLNLQKLHDADDFNFIHDITGIERHLDRDTGELTGCFRPRFAQPSNH